MERSFEAAYEKFKDSTPHTISIYDFGIYLAGKFPGQKYLCEVMDTYEYNHELLPSLVYDIYIIAKDRGYLD